MVDLEQVRARHAFARMGSVAEREGLRADVLALARRLPEMLQTNGLLAAWAFLLAKREREPARKELEEAIREHLVDEAVGLSEDVGKLEAIFATDRGRDDGSALSGHELRRLSAEAVVYAGWLKRAAEALCATAEEEAMP